MKAFIIPQDKDESLSNILFALDDLGRFQEFHESEGKIKGLFEYEGEKISLVVSYEAVDETTTKVQVEAEGNKVDEFVSKLIQFTLNPQETHSENPDDAKTTKFMIFAFGAFLILYYLYPYLQEIMK